MRLMIAAALGIAVLVASASLGGILSPETYARESAEWAGQAVGQDWFDLLVAAPALVVCALGARRGSLRWRLLLCGALLFTVYTFVLYCFAVRFNRLFPVYVAVLGLSFYSLLAVGRGLVAADLRVESGAVARGAGALLVAIAVLFAGVWLAEVVPAVVSGDVPPSVAKAGLFTNPVHVLDLSIVLPAHLAAGLMLLRRRPHAVALASVLLAFGVLMASSIVALMLVMHLRGLDVVPPVAFAMAVVAMLSAVALVALLAGGGATSTHVASSSSTRPVSMPETV
ncbi:MAG TPA: hypothetical protein VIG06_29930 [Kofleriaceae bacterium]|jgi:hypothetical protein